MSLRRLERLFQRLHRCITEEPPAGHPCWGLDPELGRDLLQSMLLSRHLDRVAYQLAQAGEGYYTIASAGHEANVVLGRLTRPSDPTLVHYRSTAFWLERARQLPDFDPVEAVCASLVAARSEPASGGRHKVFGHPRLGIIPQTSTIASHLPRAVGIAFALGRPPHTRPRIDLPDDAVAVAGFGDAAINHHSALTAFNALGWATHQGIRMPLLLVCEDNGLGISLRSPPGWVARRLSTLPGIVYYDAPPADVEAAYRAAERAIGYCRKTRKPAVLHLRCVRLLGHSAQDQDQTYRSQQELEQAEDLDPLCWLVRSLLAAGAVSADQIQAWDEEASARVERAAGAARLEPRLSCRQEVVAPLELCWNERFEDQARALEGSHGPEPMTLARGIRTALWEALEQWPEVVIFGEDVARKGGIHGVTQGLVRHFGSRRVFDTLLDEEMILGVGLGLGVCGYLPVVEIQYLGFLACAVDQLRGEAASLPFFSDGAYANPLVVRIASFADPRGPGGHFHNDHGLGLLRDVPGLVVAVPVRADDALLLYRTALVLAREHRRVVVLLEPTSLYHLRDLHQPGDRAWMAPAPAGAAPLGRARIYGSGAADLLMITYGRGVLVSLRAARQLWEQHRLRTRVLDLRWLMPLPAEDLLRHAREVGRVLVVDDCRSSGSPSEGVAALLLEELPRVCFARVTSADSFVPIGPAAAHVLVSELEVVRAALALAQRAI